MKILHVTNMYPYPEKPWYGIFIYNQIQTLQDKSENDIFFINGSESKLNYFKSIFKLMNYKNRYDIVHCHHGWTAVFVNFIFKKEKKVVSLVGGDILEDKVLYKKLINFFTRSIIKRFDRVIVKSKQMERQCDFIDSKKLSIIPNGVNLEVFRELDKTECKIRLNLDVNKKYFLFTAGENGQGRPEKRFDIISEAFKILKIDGYDEIEILCMNNVNHKDVPLYINSCEAVLLSSDYEGSPNIIKETMACNISIISTDVGNVKEMIEGIANCFIVQQDAKAFAQKIKDVLEAINQKIDARNRLIKIGLDEKDVALKILDIYNYLLEE